MNRHPGTIGILVEDDKRRKPALRTYMLHKPARMKLVCFTPSSIDWRRRQIRCLQLRNGKWTEGLVPLPKLVYNRCYRLDDEVRDRLEQAIGPGKLFNPANQFNKLDVHRSLSRWLSPYLPDTWAYDRDTAARLLSVHKLLYLKPCNGHMGQGVYRVALQDSGEVHVADHHTTPRIIAGSIAGFQEEIERLIGSTPYLIQQGIEVRQLQHRHFDIRILAQKNKTGQWSVTNAASRIAYPGCFNTSVSEKVVLSKEALGRLYPASAIKPMMKTMYDISLRAAEIVEMDIGKPMCELSVDIALDGQGHPWIIEMNGKPQKTMYAELRHTRRAVYSRPLEYANYLSRR
ncbi:MULTISPECIES: YheC/YheD family endospore coat-associated protein [Paenibacillus]|uniref:YheC/YheD family endospore coat-associated protein n=1 Tax=Paenibacillus TaxID=44249 RepID=UPI0022B8844E|nr:YheC/YheD family protein [Paenibacillus caseinilyticus]MCZ8520913.1 YheC/YheD family protein [Paenibacillus caseinilyticus]